MIADNVGDNVGDVAGMGADLFGSCAESTCAAMVISAVVFAADPNALLYPILITAVGIPVSLVTKLLIGVKTEEDVAPALRKLLIISSVLMAIVMFFLPWPWCLNFLSSTVSSTPIWVFTGVSCLDSLPGWRSVF